MSFFRIPAPVAQMQAVLDAFGEPMFLLAVDPEGNLRFVTVNTVLEEQTGLRRGDVAGKTPHDALPQRMADTVLANYEHCRATGQRYVYEEELCLPVGPRWSRTTLTPLFGKNDRGVFGVVGICGAASDITDLKTQIRDLSEGSALLRQQGAESQIVMSAKLQQVRGPVALTQSMMSLMRHEHTQSGTVSSQILEMVHTASREAIDALESLEAEAKGEVVGTLFRPVDLAKRIRDKAAAVDPNGLFSITYPTARLRADPELVDALLLRGLRLAASVAQSLIRISVRSHPLNMRRIRLVISFDGPSPTAGEPCEKLLPGEAFAAFDVLERLVAGHDGVLRIDHSDRTGDTQLEAEIHGMIDFGATTQRDDAGFRRSA